ncbi:hypothetical protein KSF_030740 [Reticulibacter mediterranei]|uniref:Pentapeptide repeat-containing protein n=1 Tax=Reticulibacter mediterranei TaxID=2778369 RepID=A0A8J3IES6_9CHLR|nr:pentapeptide repeat-containing protein [Reticulibacter mediterranei]GHO93026.1 hypothetical protein KSF_030740 [Reticulibacter mediterranei]
MANTEHTEILRSGVDMWNRWRKGHASIQPNLRRANLKRANLREANLREANLSGANLSGADLSRTDLRNANLGRADLSGAILNRANLYRTNFRNANLRRADLRNADPIRADLSGADLSGADLSGADLSLATLVETNLTEAILTNCRIYGIAVWSVELQGTKQNNLVITPDDEPIITVDNLKVAQFIYLLLNNAEIRSVIDTITSKVVLILGRFSLERKVILDALRHELRNHNYSPVIFDFAPPKSLDLTETVSTLAHLARFIIVDLTDPNSAPHEIATIAPQCIRPIKPIISSKLITKDGKEVEQWREYEMFRDLRRRYHWILDTFRYQDIPHLINSLQEDIIQPAEEKIHRWEPEKERIKELEEKNRQLEEEIEKLKWGQ